MRPLFKIYRNFQKYLKLPNQPVRHATTTNRLTDVKPIPSPLTQDPNAEVKTDPLIVSTPKAPSEYIKTTETISFDDIPGPNSLRVISKFWSTIPLISTEITVKVVQLLLTENILNNSTGNKFSMFRWLFDNYGPIVRLHGAFGKDLVILSRPEDASAALKSEDRAEARCCLDSVEKYRLESRKYRASGSFFLTASSLDKSTVVPISEQQEKIKVICDDFVKKISNGRNKQEEMLNNFNVELYKWSLECLSVIAFNKQMGFMTCSLLSTTSDPGRLLEGLVGATSAIRKCEQGVHLWKFFQTPSFKALTKNCTLIEGVLCEQMDAAVRSLRERKEKNTGFQNISLVESLLLKENVMEEDIMTSLLDMFIISGNAAAHTLAFLLYHIAKNPRCQIKLHEEIVKYGDKLNSENIKQLPYIQACIKECLRMSPPLQVLNRVLENDTVVHHYRIPKGTHVLFATHMNGTREDFFEEPQKFKPERWLSNELGSYGQEYQNFISMPFGCGLKSRTVRELTRFQMAMLLAGILKKFRMEYNYGEVKSANGFLTTPTVPVRFRFVDRD